MQGDRRQRLAFPTRSLSSIAAVIVALSLFLAAIFFLNLFLGWTLIGWVVALAWACSGTPPKSAGRA